MLEPAFIFKYPFTRCFSHIKKFDLSRKLVVHKVYFILLHNYRWKHLFRQNSQFTLEMCAEIYTPLRVKCLSFLPDFNGNWISLAMFMYHSPVLNFTIFHSARFVCYIWSNGHRDFIRNALKFVSGKIVFVSWKFAGYLVCCNEYIRTELIHSVSAILIFTK
jgi:hypothetical protein